MGGTSSDGVTPPVTNDHSPGGSGCSTRWKQCHPRKRLLHKSSFEWCVIIHGQKMRYMRRESAETTIGERAVRWHNWEESTTTMETMGILLNDFGICAF